MRQSEQRQGSFNEPFLFLGPSYNKIRNQFLVALASSVLNDAPHELTWLKHCPCPEDLIAYVTDTKRGSAWFNLDERVKKLEADRKAIVIALRGFLAFGILEQCLSRRYRVDYGIDSRRENRRVAVPYRVCDKPSDRAEYAQPDTLIVFTHLAYYHRGLSRMEVKEAIQALFNLGSVAQKKEYHEWYEAQKDSMSDDQRASLDSLEKLDPSSEAQVSLIWEVYRYTMETINFWLDKCVMPKETMQFPYKICANAFHLAENQEHKVVGFSGTKDTELLLPVQLQQAEPDLDSIRATDGKMIDVILKQTWHKVTPRAPHEPMSMAVLQHAVNRKVDALIDAGATMAGMNNCEVTESFLKILNECDHTSLKRGVVYFDNNSAQWKIVSRDGRHWPKDSSPIHESEAFVFFDESHCRGADMQLDDKATALLTVGPQMTKDKLMQAAGRMRKLGKDQSLQFAIPSELIRKICTDDATELNMCRLLVWIISNTVNLVGSSLVDWGTQGVHFGSSKSEDARVVDEILDLESMYGPERRE